MTVEINKNIYLTLEEAAEKFKIGKDYFRRKYLKSGKISASKTGKRWFIREEALTEFLNKIEK
jgi:excisionase family DNA binding protein